MMKVHVFVYFHVLEKWGFLLVCDGILVDCRINQLNIGGVFWVPWGSKPNAPKRGKVCIKLKHVQPTCMVCIVDRSVSQHLMFSS